MLGTYIKNRGMAKTIIHNNNKNSINETKWDADYDGDVANLSLNVNTDGIKKKYHFTLDNEDLAEMLNVNSVNLPLEQRLKRDFKKSFRNKPRVYQIELGNSEPSSFLTPVESPKSSFVQPMEMLPMDEPMSIEELMTPVNTHLSSPKQNEEYIIPMTIDENTFDKLTLTPRRRHYKKRTPKTHRVYKRLKTTRRSKKSHSKSHSKR